MLASFRIPVFFGGCLRRVWCLEAFLNFGNGEALAEQIFHVSIPASVSVIGKRASSIHTALKTTNLLGSFAIACRCNQCHPRPNFYIARRYAT